MRDLKGKTAFITGGASGLGLGMAHAFAESGMKLVLADIDEANLQRAAAELEQNGAQVLTVRLDIGDRGEWARAADQAEQAFGTVHVLCNNAGMTAMGWEVDQIPPDVWDMVVKVNLTGAFNGSHIFLPRIKAHKQGGHVVNTASISAVRGRAGHAVYCATKHGILGFSESLRYELEPHDIGVSVYCPGHVPTPLQQNSERIRAQQGGTAAPGQPNSKEPPKAGEYNTAHAGRAVRRAIEDNAFFILTHPEYRGIVNERYQTMMAAFDVTEKNAP